MVYGEWSMVYDVWCMVKVSGVWFRFSGVSVSQVDTDSQRTLPQRPGVRVRWYTGLALP